MAAGLLSQAASTGAPWAERPGPVWPLLAARILAAHRGAADPAPPRVATIAATALALAWLASQLQPAWSPRYLAVLVGPLLLALVEPPAPRACSPRSP